MASVAPDTSLNNTDIHRGFIHSQEAFLIQIEPIHSGYGYLMKME
ncbi:hypothetical protein ADIMK_3205 [Marinobacterium lacunae]|uniref:Uncharacterized protein n=1 Tax=Marinobacterium lacunae TaxID=1232683 RepID=A0A081FW28_9GAMM|nr:hypothetical protein ADIMK_3205 [Marinobacterium lacunae]